MVKDDKTILRVANDSKGAIIKYIQLTFVVFVTKLPARVKLMLHGTIFKVDMLRVLYLVFAHFVNKIRK